VANKDTEEARKEIERLAKEQVKREAEEAKQSKKETERLAKEEAKKKAEDEKRFKEAEAKAKKEAEKLAREQAKQAKKEPAPDAGSATYQGNFQLVLPSSASFRQVEQFAESLAGIEGLKIAWTGGSVDEGALIAISLAQAVPLVSIISKMPIVEKVEVKGEKVTITLKTTA
jgi:hypothetical protein